jgi:hypothetical protein
MKAKKGFVVASTVFVAINLLLFVAAIVLMFVFKNVISAFIINQVKLLGTESDFGFWMNTNIIPNITVVLFLIILVLCLMVAAKITFFYHFVNYSRFSIKEFYVRRTRYLTIVILQFFVIGSIFALLCGLIAIVIQKAIVTPERVNSVLNETWGQEEEIVPGVKVNANNNKPVVRVGPNARFVENISQLRDGVRHLHEAKLISNGQKNALIKKIDKLSKDNARKKEMRG